MWASGLIGNRWDRVLFITPADPTGNFLAFFCTAILSTSTDTPLFAVIPGTDIPLFAVGADDLVMGIEVVAPGANLPDIANTLGCGALAGNREKRNARE